MIFEIHKSLHFLSSACYIPPLECLVMGFQIPNRGTIWAHGASWKLQNLYKNGQNLTAHQRYISLHEGNTNGRNGSLVRFSAIEIWNCCIRLGEGRDGVSKWRGINLLLAKFPCYWFSCLSIRKLSLLPNERIVLSPSLTATAIIAGIPCIWLKCLNNRRLKHWN